MERCKCREEGGGEDPQAAVHGGMTHSFVTKSKLILLATRQANKSRDKVLGQGIAILFGKPANQEDGG